MASQSLTSPPPRGTANGTPVSDQAAVASSSKGTATAYYQSIRERRNWYIHQLYVRQEFASCLAVIEAQLRETEGTCEYALYVKGLLKRTEGALGESLALLQTAVLVSPENATNRKQFARALHLVGRHKDAIEVFREAEAVRFSKSMGEDWELSYSIGICHVYLGQYDSAIASFTRSLSAQRNDCTYLQLTEVLVLVQNYDNAEAVLEEALSFSPQNPEILVRLGQLHLRRGQTRQAFDILGRCLTLDPANARAVLAAASIIQDNGDYDVALSKYRIAATRIPDSARLWNNVGICFFGKRNVYAAIACLRKSIFLMPLEWITQYNLGIVFLFMGRYASAFQHLSATVSLHAQYAPAYMYMGVCLSLMNDTDNACAAYRKAIAMDPDPLFRLNYVITLLNSGFPAEAMEQFVPFLAQWERLSVQERRELAGGTAFAPEMVRDLQRRLDALRVADLTPATSADVVGARTVVGRHSVNEDADADADADAHRAASRTPSTISSSSPAGPGGVGDEAALSPAASAADARAMLVSNNNNSNNNNSNNLASIPTRGESPLVACRSPDERPILAGIAAGPMVTSISDTSAAAHSEEVVTASRGAPSDGQGPSDGRRQGTDSPAVVNSAESSGVSEDGPADARAVQAANSLTSSSSSSVHAAVADPGPRILRDSESEGSHHSL